MSGPGADTAPSHGVVGALPGVRVFGGMGVIGVDGPVVIRGPRQRRLLMLLTLRSGSVASADWLAEHLWHTDERPDQPASQLRTCVSRLRRALPEGVSDWIRTDSSGYCLDAPASRLEHRRFAHLRAEATSARRQNDPTLALSLLDQALALWRGEPFQELDDCSVAAAEIEQLRIDRLEMLEERWECSLALGRHTQITGELAVFTTEHQFRSRATQQYALALHRSGRTAEALRAVSRHRRFLLEEAGLEPSAEMIELEQAMLVGDSGLEAKKSSQPLPGYRLLEEIGSGAFSNVWRGMQLSVAREVAIKQIRPELAQQPEFMRRFEQEAQLIASVEHPHVVPLIDFWHDLDAAYLVMGLLRGGTLERRLAGGPLGVEDTLTIAGQIAGALSAAHRRGIIHRDVKPGNIMFDEEDNAFLGDFGIAVGIGESISPAAMFSTGSPAYSAPEQTRREVLGPQADVFSLGMVVFECLTGTAPAARRNNEGNSDWSPANTMGSNIPVHIARAITRATDQDPANRFATVADFIAALHDDSVACRTSKDDRVALAPHFVQPTKKFRNLEDSTPHQPTSDQPTSDQPTSDQPTPDNVVDLRDRPLSRPAVG